ncbi:MAG: S41 family peptidase [Crocinitomicaceae bacterium]|nr:hypothetical protein [Crocinitomicaceae bacterium]
MTYPKLITVVLFVAILFKGTSQDDFVDTAVFSKLELQEDLNFWKNKLQGNHPILYQYNSKESFEKYFDSLNAEIKESMTRAEFFRLIAPSSYFVKCSHSQIMATQNMKTQIVGASNMLPVDIRWYSGMAYISYNYSGNEKLVEGTNVKSINGVSTEEMYIKALSLLPRDGNSTQYPKYWVNRIFYYYYHLWYDLYDTYDIETYSGNKISVSGMSVQEMDSVKANRPKIGLEKPEMIRLQILDSINTAYLQIGSFTDADIKNNNGKSWKKMLDSCFSEIKNSSSEFLIIDLQENGGGNPTYAWYLCRYFMNTEFVFKKEFRKIKDPSKSDYEERTKRTLLKDKTVGPTKPHKNSFKGDLFLLVDGGTCSASAEVTSVVERYKRGVIIGEEVGGSSWLISSRWFFTKPLQLPNTELIYLAPRRTSVMGDYKNDTGYGTIPDIQVQPSIESYLKGEDIALTKALELIHLKLYTIK